MNFPLVFLVLSVVSAMMMASVDSCQFGNDAIQAVYDRFELFRKTKAFDPIDPKIPLEQYSFSDIDPTKLRLALKISGVYMVEYYVKNGDKIVTQNGQYHVKDSVILNYNRNENGEFSFDDWSNGKKFESTLRSIDAELPDNFEGDYKQVLVDLNAMRKKMFDYQNGLSNEDRKLVQLFEFSPFSAGGFHAQYIENGGGSLTVSKQNGKDDISGRFSCNYMDQKYNIVDGKVVVDGEPFVPVYH